MSMEAVDMFRLAVRMGGKLPEPLHEKMLLWSFEDKSLQIVKDYLAWVERCEERDKRRIEMKKRMDHIDKMDRAISFAFLAVSVAFSISVILSSKIR